MYLLCSVLLFCFLQTVVSHSFCENEDKVTLKCNFFPKDIPNRISRVRIQNFMEQNMKLDISAKLFMTKNWGYIQYLELSDDSSSTKVKSTELNFEDGCFIHLKALVELQIHITNFSLAADVFIGINSVKVLDMSGCVRLSINDLAQSLNGTDKLPNLEQLKVSRINTYHLPNVINITVGQVLQQKRLVLIDASKTQVNVVDIGIIRYLKSLRKINVSSSFVGDIEHESFNASDMLHLQWVDGSYVVLPKSWRPIPGKMVLSNLYLINPRVLDNINGLLAPKLVNFTSVFPSQSSVWLINCTMVINKPLTYYQTREIVFKRNNIKYVDLRCINNSFTSIEIIDFSENGLEFVSPFVSSCIPRIKAVHLSSNKLFTMAERNFSLFGNLTQSFLHLQFINASANNLRTIPVNMFSNNFNLDTIDLSFNKLQQVTFALEHLVKLKVLNLQNNYIQILDDVSINRLDSIPYKTKFNKHIPVVILKSNRISCSKCDAKPFIQWLIRTRLVNITLQELTCIDDDNVQKSIDKHTVRRLRDMCNLVLYILLSCISATFVVMITVISVYRIYKRRLRALQLKHRYDVIQLLKHGEGQYKYACYLMFIRDDTICNHHDNIHDHDNGNSHDNLNNHDDGNNHCDRCDLGFMKRWVIKPLKYGLKKETNIGRSLVCYDKGEQLAGRSIFETIFKFLKSSPVVIVFASETFFSDNINCFVLELPLVEGKPILFMTRNDAVYDFKTQEARSIFRNSKKINWKIQNEEFIVQTSWEEISKSILDLIRISPQNTAENL